MLSKTYFMIVQEILKYLPKVSIISVFHELFIESNSAWISKFLQKASICQLQLSTTFEAPHAYLYAFSVLAVKKLTSIVIIAK